MKLTSYTDYTLRVLMYLALNQEKLATIQSIAQAYGISESHLTKVVHHLGKTGVIETLRGKAGGIRLARAASEISIGKVVREAEGDSPIVECFGANDSCRITPNCKLAGVLAKAVEAFYATLDACTLADLVARPQALKQILKIL